MSNYLASIFAPFGEAFQVLASVGKKKEIQSCDD